MSSFKTTTAMMWKRNAFPGAIHVRLANFVILNRKMTANILKVTRTNYEFVLITHRKSLTNELGFGFTLINPFE